MLERPRPENHEVSLGSPFCSDPNCTYCRELRELREEISKNKEKDADAA